MTQIAPNSAVTDVRQSPNYSPGRPAGAPNQIVIHHWGVDGQTHQGVVGYLCSRSNHGASAHYVASAGRVTQLVSDRDRAWHAGSSGNPRGIGIECRPEMSDGDFETVAGLVAAIRSEHGDLPLRGHRDHMSTACPGRWYARLRDLDARARQIAGGAAPAAPAPAPAGGGLAVDGVIGWASIRALQAALGTPVDGLIGPDTVRAWQARLGVAVDGYLGAVTARAIQTALNAGRVW